MNKLLLACFLFFSYSISAQDISVSGQVTTASDPQGLPGVNVVIKGTNTGTITDVEGRFALSIPAGSVLSFSFIGYQSQDIVVTSQATLQIRLAEDAQQLDEVVVVGYNSVEQRNITGALTTVKASAFKDISVNGFDQALQGQAAGVQVTQSSGTPGGGVMVRIRGATSVSAANNPIYIVDGVQIESGGMSARSFGGQNDNALAMLNPGDIESIVVLKDAATKAIYGSRGSNGVVLITTKRGKNGPSKIELDVQRGIIDPTRTLDLLNSTELLALQREAVTNSGQDPNTMGLIPGVTDGVSTDWQDAVLRTGILQQYTLTASGGDAKTRFYISGNFRDEEGVQLNNKFQRMAMTMNFDHSLNEKLTISTNLSLSRALNKRVKSDNFLDGVYSGAIKSLPYAVPYNENGALVGPGSPLYADFPNFNPVAQALLPRFDVFSVKVIGRVKATYKFNEFLSANGQVSLDYNDITEDNYESSQTAVGGTLPSVGGQGLGIFIAQTVTRVMSYGTINYNRSFGKHNFSAVAGTEVLQDFASGGNVQGRLFSSDDFTYIQSAGVVDAGSSFRQPQHGIFSLFGSVDYNLEERLLFSATFRTDASSNFGRNYRNGIFPAVSVGWRISEEKFFNTSVLNDLKLRASFGFTGNERIPAFTYLGLWNSTTYSGSTGVSPAGLDNPDVKWESTSELNLGVDLSLFESRVQTSVQAYYNKTTDLLLLRPYSLTTGFGGLTSNIGTLGNKGLELSINSVNIDKELKWKTTINLSKNLNQIISLEDDEPLFRGYDADGAGSTNAILKGEPLGTFYGLNYLGVNPATGDAMYEDANLDGIISASDAMAIGNAQPLVTGGVTNSFSYMGFDVMVLFNFSVGNKILNLTKQSLVNMGADLNSNQTREALRRWQKPGDVTDVPRYEFENTTNNLQSNRLLEDGSYLRLKNLTLGYNLPPKWTNRFNVSQMRVYVTGTNIWTLTRYTGSDPEVSTLDGSTSAQGIDFFTLPQVRTIAAGLTLTLQ
jgi:TonB-linked SusC/RagA family outer membrane protein